MTQQPAPASVDFDVIVVGAGIAGSVAAYQLAKAGHEVLLVERGAQPGAKNLSGGILYCRVMEQVWPDFITQAPVERRITRNKVVFLNEGSLVGIDYWDERLAEPAIAVTVLRAKLDAWLGEQCESAGVTVMSGMRVDALVTEGDRVTGVRAGEDVLRSHVVVAADGVNSFLCRNSGIRAKEPTKHLAVGVKSVIGLPRTVIEDRFGVTGDDGVAYAVVGDCTLGLGGGGFMYTNRDSVSVGVVVRLDELEHAPKASASDIHDRFLAHPAIAPLLKGGELLQYGCHLVAEGGLAMVHDLVRPGLVVVGDAAGLTLNTGLTVRGMDLAAGSSIAAARVVHEALAAGDTSAERLSAYPAELEEGFVGRDLRTYAKAPAFLETRRMYKAYGLVAADVLHGVFDLDTTPRRHLLPTAFGALRRSPVKMRQVLRDGIGAVRAL
jgi:electron transfer flavoprotein-quinone oxidoreductase